MNIIEIENLSHRFADGTFGIEDINLSIQKGSFVVIAGLNGSGKTTLLRHLNGLLLPTAGTVRLAGNSVEQDLLLTRQMVGMVFQKSNPFPMSIWENVAFGGFGLYFSRS